MDNYILEREQVFIFMSCNVGFYENLVVSINSAKFYSTCPIFLFLGVKDKKTEEFFSKKLKN